MALLFVGKLHSSIWSDCSRRIISRYAATVASSSGLFFFRTLLWAECFLVSAPGGLSQDTRQQSLLPQVCSFFALCSELNAFWSLLQEDYLKIHGNNRFFLRSALFPHSALCWVLFGLCSRRIIWRYAATVASSSGLFFFRTLLWAECFLGSAPGAYVKICRSFFTLLFAIRL